MLQKEKCTFYGGGHQGAEITFAEAAEKWGVEQAIFSFPGQQITWQKEVKELSDAELKRGDISMELVSKMMGRKYYDAEKIRKVLQTIFHMVNNGHQVFVVGTILDDNTVKGGTGWAVELAKLFNRPLSVFDQNKNQWFTWDNGAWKEDSPVIKHLTFTGSGTRNLNDAGRKAIFSLFEKSFGPA